MLLGISFAGSLLAGLLASFVASEIMPIFHDSRALRAVAKRPILGMISMLQTEAQMRVKRRSAYLFAGGLGAFLATFTAVIVLAQLFARMT
jgi:hypothetical protein